MRHRRRLRQRYGSVDRGEYRQQPASLLRRSEISDVVKSVEVCSFSLGAKMSYAIGRCVRIGSVIPLGTILTVGLYGEAFARHHHKGHLRARSSLSESRAQLAPEQPAQPGQLRYYGGPKSPMWR